VERKRFIISKIFVILLLFTTAVYFAVPPCQAHGHSKQELQKKKRQTHAKMAQTHAKIVHLKFLENLETNKLYKNQQKLEVTSTSLQSSKQQLVSTETRLNSLEGNLSRSLAEFSSIDFQMKRRIRQIYKNQHGGFFELLLNAQDFNTFLDRLYFEGIVIKGDYRRMAYARAKAKQIALLKYQIEEQKRTLARSIRNINYQQASIQEEIGKNHNMIQKLRTDRATYERSERDLARQSASIESMIARRTRTSFTFKKGGGAISGGGGAGIRVSGGFLRPIGGMITSPFGWRVHPIFHSRTFHSGVDIAGPYGASVHAANSGRVIYAGWYGGYGKVVILDHGVINGVPITTLYAHMCATNVSPGQTVSKGQTVGREGTTGYSTGPHVHFEVRVNGRPTNPLSYI
jgi:murein DD-endopeptidase MepM/ murein hydrolase activator NlpD